MRKYFITITAIILFGGSIAGSFVWPGQNFIFGFLNACSFFIYILPKLSRIGKKQAAESAALLDKLINDRISLSKNPSYESDTDM